MIRGDLEVSEAKVSALLGGEELSAATPEQLQRAGLVAGYASPVGVKEGAASEAVLVIGDDSLVGAPNLVAGANEPGYHLINVNYPRDYAVDRLADIALARAGDPAPSAARRCSSRAASKWGTCSSWAPATAMPWAPPTSTPRAAAPGDHGQLWHRPGAAAGLHHRTAP